ncbi:hypothetical protein CAL26_21075 [Bordetella genomosp. 9]|uniref:Uncharacterized protein n=1 Tax=Bordetella genomosp. 9 TaxID=1416803 RepID=A0A261R4V1_9BORD|nr:hypothetical protein [Bordetella genomosp. 9]OZI20049.1 hypothetical protein CAL26_21075 [Bordetella genomosp. 9]
MIVRSADSGVPAAVGVAGAGYTYLGLPLSDWVSIFTIVYLFVHAVAIAPRALETIRKVVAHFKNKN